jgi:hypothetical protein
MLTFSYPSLASEVISLDNFVMLIFSYPTLASEVKRVDEHKS